MSGVGSQGLRSAIWRDVRRALRRLGGVHTGTSTKHGIQSMKMPNGGVPINVGKADSPREPFHASAVAQLLSEVEAAGVPPVLFLAVLQNEGGCTWYSLPDEDVLKLARRIRTKGLAVHTPELWATAMAEIGVKIKPPSKAAQAAARIGVRLKPDKRPSEPPTWAPPATQGAEAPQAQAKPSKPATGSSGAQPTLKHTFNLRQAAELAGFDSATALSLSQSHTKWINRRSPPYDHLIDQGHLVIERSPESGRRRFHLDEHAALAVAEAMVRARGAPEPSTKTVVTMRDEEATATEPPEAKAVVEAKNLSPAEALLALCRDLGIRPRYRGFGLDVERLIVEIEARLRETR